MSIFRILAQHRLNIAIMTVLMATVGIISSWNMAGYPMRFEDEGTYVAQAWAVQYRGQLTNYTYWYDHPPLGWLQMAGWTTATDAFDRYGSSITAGREFMVVVRVITAALLFALTRRLGFSRLWAAAAVLLFGLSPLSIDFGRYVLLDNIGIPWLLAALVLALSPKKSLAAVAGSAFCMAVAALTKATFLILLPVVVYALWRNSDIRNRRFAFVLFGSILGFMGSFYVLFSALKNELFEGPGHVSLIGAIKWQLFGRQGSGSITDPQSGAYGLMNLWLSIDPWLLVAGSVLLPVALFVRRLRIPALALFIQVVMMLRPGYLPFPYIIAMLPFAALMIAGTGDALTSRLRHEEINGKWQLQLRAACVVIVLAAFVQVVVPAWGTRIAQDLSGDADKPARQTVDWITARVPRNQRLVVDSALWVDLVKSGYQNPEAVWLYKTETDPAVVRSLSGWRGIQYVAVSAATLDPRNEMTFPTLFQAKRNAVVAASFGEGSNKIVILQVQQTAGESAKVSAR